MKSHPFNTYTCQGKYSVLGTTHITLRLLTMLEFTCPKCAELVIPFVTLNDGGSTFCQKCKTNCHRCTDGSGGYGSPFDCCQKLKSLTAESFDCPRCRRMFTPSDYYLDGGSCDCTFCGMNCHRCQGNLGRPGNPLQCRFCKPAYMKEDDTGLFSGWTSPFL